MTMRHVLSITALGALAWLVMRVQRGLGGFLVAAWVTLVLSSIATAANLRLVGYRRTLVGIAVYTAIYLALRFCGWA